MNIPNTAQFEGIPAFTVIAGSNVGGWTDRDMVNAMLQAIDAVGGETGLHYKSLAMDTDDTIDMDWYSDITVDALCDHTPECTYMSWQDNEFTVLPNLEEAQEDYPCGGELPDTRPVEGYFLQISDHGNATLYRWAGDDHTGTEDWSKVWGMV